MTDKAQRPTTGENLSKDWLAWSIYADALETELRDTKALHAYICDLIFKTLCSIRGGKSFSGCLEEIKGRLGE